MDKVFCTRKYRIACVCIGVLSLILALSMFFAPVSYDNDAGYISSVLLIIFSILSVCGALPLSLFSESGLSDKIASAIFAVLLMVMIGIDEILGSPLLSLGETPFRVFMGILYISMVFIAVFSLLLKFLTRTLYRESQPLIRSKKTLVFCIAAVALTSFAFFAACPDGLVYSDGVNVWQQTQNNVYSDWHPIVFVLIVKLCSLVYNSTASYCFLLAALWALTNAFVLCILHRNHGVRACKIYVILSLTWGLIAYKYIVYIYKDPLFCMAMLGFFAFLYDFLRGKRGVSTFIALLLYGLLASLVRHSMILPVSATLVIIIICSLVAKIRNKEKNDRSQPKGTIRFLALLLVLLIVLNSVAHAFAMKITDASENPPYIMYTVPIHMLGAYAASGHDVDAETREIMERVMPIEEWAEGYNANPYWADNLSRQYGYIGNRVFILEKEISGAEIIGANLRFVLLHPITYIDALKKINSMVWQISRPDGFNEWYDPYFNNSSDTAYLMIENYELSPNGFTKLIEPILTFFKQTPVVSNIACRGGAALFVLLLCAYIMWRKKHRRAVLFMLPAVFLAFVLMLTVPAQDPRYILWAIELAVLAIPIAICTDKKQQ